MVVSANRGLGVLLLALYMFFRTWSVCGDFKVFEYGKLEATGMLHG